MGIAATTTAWTTLRQPALQRHEVTTSISTDKVEILASQHACHCLAPSMPASTSDAPVLPRSRITYSSPSSIVPQRTIVADCEVDSSRYTASPASAPVASLMPSLSSPSATPHAPTSDLVHGGCVVYDLAQQLRPMCTTTHYGDEFSTQFVTTCQADAYLPPTCAALSLFHSKATTNHHHDKQTNTTNHHHPPQHQVHSAYFCLSILQTLSMVWALVKYLRKPKAAMMCVEKGPRQAFGV
eukprot:2996304-Amphidinium_carterae.1